MNRFRRPAAGRPRPGRDGRIQRWSRVELEPVERVVGEQQAAVEVDPVRQRGDDRRAGDPDRRLLHAAEEGPEAELARALEHRPGRADAAALGELDVDPGHDPDEAVEVLGQDAALVGDDRQGRSLLELPEQVEAARRERLLDQLDAEPLEVGAGSPGRSSSVQPVLASTRIGPP